LTSRGCILLALKPSQKLGILCAMAESLNDDILGNYGITDRSRIVVAGAQDLPEFSNILNCTGHFNSRKVQDELVGLATPSLVNWLHQSVAQRPYTGYM